MLLDVTSIAFIAVLIVVSVSEEVSEEPAAVVPYCIVFRIPFQELGC